MSGAAKKTDVIEDVGSDTLPVEVISDPLLTPGSDVARVSQATVTDYISGRQVRATPEEIEATQVLARKLVDDFGYPKTHIQTRPQYRVQ